MRALLLHVPKGFSSSDWSHNYINIMPMGLAAIANYANRAGHDVRIMNAAPYGSFENALALIESRLRESSARVVGLPIHWHYSGFDVCRAASEIRARFPHVFIVLGGITASVYSEEFMRACPAVDGVISGEGELPFLELLEALEAGKGLEEIPNLLWREKEGSLRRNPQSYVATSQQLSALDFDPMKALYDVREYAVGNGMSDAVVGKPYDYLSESLASKLFFLNIGRGCNLNCIYCAGSSLMFSKFFNRNQLSIRTPSAVVKTAADAYEAGFRRFHICFDPPFPEKDAYFADVFGQMQRHLGPDVSLLFETYNLPTPRFIESASRFHKASLIVSPCFFDDTLMPRYKGYYFKRGEMEAVLKEAMRYDNVEAFVYFAILPFENWDSDAISRHVATMRSLEKTFRCRASAMPIAAEPGSPWVHFPSKYSVNVPQLGFEDFWQEWQKPLDSWLPHLCHSPSVDAIYAELLSCSKNPVLGAAGAFLGEGG